MAYKIGSLFDGSGGFPLAASMCGMKPVWASEVEPYPIAVTRSRFPDMTHLGDVSKINGSEIEPVDVITFGSPCQDMSIAGKRAGIKNENAGDDETTRSGLFWEAARIIKEMREATNGVYPRFAVWENVPGAFSSNKGEDFRLVIKTLVQIVEPAADVPPVPKSGWSYYDCWMGDGWSLAYRTFDAQYWGVPQRRRRIYLVLDLGGQRAGEILFKRESLRGYFTESGEAREGTAENAERSVGVCDSAERFVGSIRLDNTSANPYGGDTKSPTIATGTGHGGTANIGVCLKTYCLQGNTIDRNAKQNGCGICEDVAFTLDAVDRHGVVAVLPFDTTQVTSPQNGNNPKWGDPCHTLAASGNPPTVFCMAHGQANAEIEENLSPCLNCNHEQPIIFDKEVYNSGINATGGHYIAEGGPAPTLRTDGHPPGVCIWYIVRRLTPTECARLQGFPDRWGDIPRITEFSDDDDWFWLEVRQTADRIGGRPARDYTGKQILSWHNKLHTDSAEYKMWGNGIALPNALYVMQGISEEFERLE